MTIPRRHLDLAFSVVGHRGWWLALLLSVLAAGTGYADEAETPWRVVNVWRQQEGLPQDYVNAICQTRDGYLWIGTRSGLCRFDGARFTLFDNHAKDQVHNNEVRALAEAADGSLWIGTYGGGVSHLKDGRFSTYTVAEGLSSNFIFECTVGPDGRVWFGTENGLSCFSDGQFVNYSMGNSGQPSPASRAIWIDPDGTVWIGTTGAGLFTIRDGQLRPEAVPGLAPTTDVRAIVRDHSHNLWLTTGRDGVFRVTPSGVITHLTTADGLPSNHMGRTYVGGDGTLWFATDDGLASFHRGKFSSMEVSRVPAARLYVTAVHADAEGNLWIGVAGKGLARLRQRVFMTYGVAEGLGGRLASAIYQDSALRTWVGSSGALALRTGERLRTISAEGLPADFTVHSLGGDRHGNLWIGSETGLFYGSADRAANPADRAVFTSVLKNGQPIRRARNIIEDRSGAMWIGTDNEGLVRIKDGHLTHFTVKDGLANNVVRGLGEDNAGNLWFGTRAGLQRFKDGVFTTFTVKDGLADNEVVSLYIDASDTLWIATRDGLNRFSDGKFTTYTAATGLFSDYIYGIIEDTYGFLWLSSPNGPFRVEKAQLEAVANGTRATVASRSFGLDHGLNSTVCTTGFNPTVFRTQEGRIWFATQDGASVVDPRPTHLSANGLPPPVRIEELTIDRRVADLHEPVKLPPARGDITFRYTALSFVAPERVHFKYKLVGYEDEWVDAGARREAFYSKIPPGDYTFRVIAANNDGVWNNTGAELRFSIAPHFYETAWFSTLVGAGVVLIGVNLHRLRTRQLRRRQIELEHLVLERRQAAEALRESEERYRSFFENDLAGAFIATPDGRILACNPAFAEIFGFASIADALTQRTTSLFPTTAAHDASLAQLRRERRIAHAEIEMRRTDGKPVHIVASLIGSFGADDELREIKGYMIDASERKQLEDQLRQSQKMEAVGQLAGGIAHDFNNLLTAIIGNSELLALEPELTPEVVSRLNEIRNAGNLAAVLTRQLLTFSRRQIVQPRVLDLNVLVAELEKLLRRLIGEHLGLTILPAPRAAWIEADPGQLEQVVLNLVINARDAMPHGGRISISITLPAPAEIPSSLDNLAPGPCVQLAISDTGTGMSGEVQAHLFEPFFTTKPVGQGTGLGLSTVYGIVRQSHGHITVQSTLGVGSTFTILLPHVASPARVDAAQEPLPALRGEATILLVEDSEPVRQTAMQILRRHGYTVIETASAAEALRHCAAGAPALDLVLSDIVMPGVSGIELAKHIALLRPYLPVVLMSGYTEDAIASRGPGFSDHFIQKPFTAESLLRKIHEVLHRSSPMMVLR